VILESKNSVIGQTEKGPDFGVKNAPSLGMYAKYSSSHEYQGLEPPVSNVTSETQRPLFDPETGEILQPEKPEYCPVPTRLERFIIQAASRKACLGSKVVRIKNCLRLRQKGFDISVHRSKEHSTCAYGGLQTCGSVWVCPVCAAKISERRKHELQKAIEQHKQSAGDVLLLTLTNPHYLGDKLAYVLAGQTLALKYFNAGRSASEFNQSIGYMGSVRALEVTHGRKRAVNNGWHPHYHILLFVQSGLDLGFLRYEIWLRWLKACQKANMPALPDLKHGVSLEDGSKAAAYASQIVPLYDLGDILAVGFE